MNGDNGYGDLVAAARQIDDEEFSPYGDCTREQVAESVNRHASTLAAARQALQRPCRLEVRMEAAFLQEHILEISALRQLIRLFGCEAGLAARRQDLEQVIRSSLDLLKLGNAIRRGGMVLDFLVSIAGSGTGVDRLRKERAKFSDEQRSTLIAELLRIEAESEPIEAIIARDREWEIVATNIPEAEAQEFKPWDPEERNISIADQRELHELVQERSLPPDQQRQMERGFEHFEQAMLRLLVTDLALRRFQAAQKVFPNRLHLLAPKFVASLPVDPFTKAPFIYRRHGEGFELYSTGPKAVDGGGSFGHKRLVIAHQADLSLDVSDYLMPDNIA